MDLNNLAYADEPFVVANDVAQVFYVNDMSTKPRKRKYKEANASYDEPKRHIVLSGKRNIVGVDERQTCQKIMKSLMKLLHSQ